jgi:pyridoxamine 5'-phosphate oxidase
MTGRIPAEPEYRPLRKRDLAADPLVQFDRWMREAVVRVRLPEAAALATADEAGRPGLRMVLLKSWQPGGLVFYTNYASRKASDLAANPRAALLCYWEPLGRQVRIEGSVLRLPAGESDAYFATRPTGAQLGAHASRQSQPIGSRELLEERVARLARRYGASRPPRPPWWGGYRLAPDHYEFWQHREDRLHDRFRYLPDGAGWRIERLQP